MSQTPTHPVDEPSARDVYKDLDAEKREHRQRLVSVVEFTDHDSRGRACRCVRVLDLETNRKTVVRLDQFQMRFRFIRRAPR